MSDRYLRQLLREAQQGIVPLQDYVAAALRVSPPEEVIADLRGFDTEDIRLAMRLVWIPVYAAESKENKARVELAIALEVGEINFSNYSFFERNQALLSDKDWRLFAADCAEHVLHHWETKYPLDNRPRKAIEAARRFARGEATAQQLAAAGSAAQSAAGSAAWYAAWYAAWSAAQSATGSSAGSAVWSAGVAARDAAGSAARSAARDASWSAARQAEISWQRQRLSDYLTGLSAHYPLPQVPIQ